MAIVMELAKELQKKINSLNAKLIILMNVNLEPSWKRVLEQEFTKPYFLKIKEGILKSKSEGRTVFPPGPEIFNAFTLTPFDKLKVVILGQDPYHGEGQAMGLCFSVKPKVKIPRSLNRIYKELYSDIGCTVPDHGDLSSWASQGVFMPNAILTVEAGSPASHSKIGWHHFTDAVIKAISDHKEGVCFMLWGGFAKGKKKLIDTSKHHIFESAHPSPLAGNAFFGNHHFSSVNKVLEKRGDAAIDWQIQ